MKGMGWRYFEDGLDNEVQNIYKLQEMLLDIIKSFREG
jgi:hypothetical protein